MKRSLFVVLFTLILSVGCASWRNDPAASAVTPKTTVEAADSAKAAPVAQASAAPTPNDPPPPAPPLNPPATPVAPPAATPAPASPPAAQPQPLRQYTIDGAATRAEFVDIHTDSGRAFGPAVRPENLKPGQHFVVSAYDNLYGMSEQMTADRTGREVIPKDGKVGRLRALEDALVATRKAGAPEPMPGIPDAEWDYKTICIVVCGCQPMNLTSWQLKNPPPLMVVTYPQVQELLGRVGVLESEVREVKKDVREVKKDVAGVKTEVASTKKRVDKIERRMTRGTKIALGVGTGIGIVALAALADGGSSPTHRHPGPDPLPLSASTNSTAAFFKEGAYRFRPVKGNATTAGISSNAMVENEELATSSEIPIFAQRPASMRKMTQVARHLVVDLNIFAPKEQRSVAIGVRWSW